MRLGARWSRIGVDGRLFALVDAWVDGLLVGDPFAQEEDLVQVVLDGAAGPLKVVAALEGREGREVQVDREVLVEERVRKA